MSITIGHMLLCLRKQGPSDSVGPPSQGVELITFRAAMNGTMPLEAGEDDLNIGPSSQRN